jgi:hypothetical protein
VTATGSGVGWKGTLVVTEGAPGVFVIFISFGISLRKSVLVPRLLAARSAALTTYAASDAGANSKICDFL